MTNITARHGFSGTCACPIHTSRRQFLAGAAAFSAAAVIPDGMSRAQAAKPRLIDTHHHFYAPAYQKAWMAWEDQRKIPHFGTQVSWTK